MLESLENTNSEELKMFFRSVALIQVIVIALVVTFIPLDSVSPNISGRGRAFHSEKWIWYVGVMVYYSVCFRISYTKRFSQVFWFRAVQTMYVMIIAGPVATYIFLSK